MTMKVRIEDKEALQALSWKALRAYLDQARGWKYAEDMPGKAAVYQHTGKGKRLREVVVPLRNDFADYAARMGDAVGTLARVEDRSELDIYDDLWALGARLDSGTRKDAEPSPLAVDEATRAVHARIRKWLAEEGWHVREVSDPQSIFNVMATLHDGNNVNIFQYRDHFDQITLSQHCVFDEQAQLAVSRLPLAVQRKTVHLVLRDVSIMGADLTDLEVPSTEMRIRTRVYFDALTKDTFIQRILLTIRALSLSLRTFVLALEESTYSVQAASHPVDAEGKNPPAEQHVNGDPIPSMGPEEADSPIEQTTDLKTGYSVEVKEAEDSEEPASNVVAFRPRTKMSDGKDDSRTIAS